jgi:hypothetical protein
MAAGEMTKGPDFLRWQVLDAWQRFYSAPADMKISRARKLIRAKFERGDYEILQVLDDETLERMAQALVEATS